MLSLCQDWYKLYTFGKILLDKDERKKLKNDILFVNTELFKQDRGNIEKFKGEKEKKKLMFGYSKSHRSLRQQARIETAREQKQNGGWPRRLERVYCAECEQILI